MRPPPDPRATAPASTSATGATGGAPHRGGPSDTAAFFVAPATGLRAGERARRGDELLLAGPRGGLDDVARRAAIVRSVALFISLLVAVLIVATLAVQPLGLVEYATSACVLALEFVALGLLGADRERYLGLATMCALMGPTFGLVWFALRVGLTVTVVGLLVNLVVVAGAVFPRRGTLVAGGLAGAFVIALDVATAFGWQPLRGAYGPPASTIAVVAIVPALAWLGGWVARGYRAAWRQLAHDRARMEQLLRELPDGFAVFDQAGVIRAANPAFCELVGRDPAEVLGRSALELTNRPEDLGFAREKLAALLQGQGGEEFTMSFVDGRGRPRVSETRPRLLQAPDGQRWLYLLARDVTEREEAHAEREALEAQLRRSQRLESVGRLAGGIAHDFNNVLTVVYTHAAELAEDATDPETREAGAAILRAADRARTLTRQLLAFGRRQVLRPETVAVQALIAETCRLLERLLGERVLLEQVSRCGPAHVHVDPGQLEQALVNLAVNARDAMPRGGRLAFEVDVLDVPPERLPSRPAIPAGAWVRIAVVDEGLGMDADTLQRVFEPFFTTKGPDAGTGLGLAMVHGFMVQSGGHVHVESEVGRGSRFELYLRPAEPPHASLAASAPSEPPRRSGGPERIVLVEDDALVRASAARTLGERGYRVEAFADADAAALAVRRDPPALLVSDVVMPRRSGPELVAELRAAGFTAPVLFISGYPGDADHPDRARLTGEHLLRKPFTPTDLAAKVRELLDAAPAG